MIIKNVDKFISNDIKFSSEEQSQHPLTRDTKALSSTIFFCYPIIESSTYRAFYVTFLLVVQTFAFQPLCDFHQSLIV